MQALLSTCDFQGQPGQRSPADGRREYGELEEVLTHPIGVGMRGFHVKTGTFQSQQRMIGDD
jgi:hypothetical protein